MKSVFYFYLKTGGMFRPTQYYFVRGVSKSWTWMSKWTTTILCPVTCELKRQAICPWCNALCLQRTGCVPSTPSFMKGKMVNASGYYSVAVLQSFRQKLEGLINPSPWWGSILQSGESPLSFWSWLLIALVRTPLGHLWGGCYRETWSSLTDQNDLSVASLFVFSSPQSFSHGFYGDRV